MRPGVTLLSADMITVGVLLHKTDDALGGMPEDGQHRSLESSHESIEMVHLVGRQQGTGDAAIFYHV